MRHLLSTSTILAAAVVPIIVACGGREVSLGSNHSALTGIDPGAVSGTVTACGAGAAHPNVCCQAGPNTPSSCGVYADDPFHPCDDGYKTYPDPRSCCDLNNPSSCSTPPAPGNGGGGGGSCGYACPPGWYPISGGCCQTTNGKDGVCYASGGGSGGGGGGGGIDGGAFDDGGPITIDGGCAPVDASNDPDASPGCTEPPQPPPTFDAGPVDPPPPPSCNASCPPGWQVASNAPDVCCRETAPNEFECFSQATGPDGPPTVVDAGPAEDGGSSTPGRACGGSSTGDCSCQETTNGHSYDVSCSDSTGSCTCTVDGVTSSSVSNVKACNGPQSIGDVWTNNCQFPQ